jgi:hypothetical protein
VPQPATLLRAPKNKSKKKVIRLGKVAQGILKPFIVILIGACRIFNVKMSE